MASPLLYFDLQAEVRCCIWIYGSVVFGTTARCISFAVFLFLGWPLEQRAAPFQVILRGFDWPAVHFTPSHVGDATTTHSSRCAGRLVAEFAVKSFLEYLVRKLSTLDLVALP